MVIYSSHRLGGFDCFALRRHLGSGLNNRELRWSENCQVLACYRPCTSSGLARRAGQLPLGDT